MKKIIAITLAVLMAVMTFAFTSCGDKKTTDSDLAYVQDKGTLVVGITDFEPMDYKVKGSDEWVGFDADMAKAFAKDFQGVCQGRSVTVSAKRSLEEVFMQYYGGEEHAE